jgi:VWFA-related protein
MKKIIVVLVFLSLLGVSVFAQTTRKTRPRIVQNPDRQETQNDTSRSGPPVLKGDTSKIYDEPPPLPTRSPDPIEDDEIVVIETNLVTMPVTVLDRNGRFVSGLQQRDFEIFENNVRQEVGYFARVETPFTVILMIDVSPSTQYEISQIHNSAISFVNLLRRDDKVMVVSFDEKYNVLSRPTNDRNILRNAILQARIGNGTSLYDAVSQVINRELPAIEGRKAVVLFSDGVDTTSRRASYQTTIRQAEEAEALFYPVFYDTFNTMSGGRNIPQPQSRYPGPRNRRGGGGIGGIIGEILGGVIIGGIPQGGGSNIPAGSTRGEYETGKRYLEELARNSGGRMFEAAASYNLDSAFAGVAEELRQQYQIGYYPKEIGQKGDRKSIRIRVMRPNLIVRAKNSYIVGEGSNKFAGK